MIDKSAKFQAKLVGNENGCRPHCRYLLLVAAVGMADDIRKPSIPSCHSFLTLSQSVPGEKGGKNLSSSYAVFNLLTWPDDDQKVTKPISNVLPMLHPRTASSFSSSSYIEEKML